MGKTFLFLFFLLVFTSCFGQSKLAPKFIEKVYSDIFNSMTNGKIKKPSLIVIEDSSKIIYYSPDLNSIVFSEKFTTVMRSFGVDSMNATAHVLGHELAHVILQQGDFLKLGSGYADDQFNEKLKNYQGILKDSLAFFERQADENAIFYAHISGYQTTHIAGRVLNSIYLNFNLKDKKLKNYPELKERISMVESASKRMEVLLKFYDFGIMATMKSQYDHAIYFFELIQTEKFYSKEIFNNLGSVYLMKVKSILKDKYPFELPFQIDSYSSLSQQRDSPEKIELLIEASERSLNEAIRIDKNYYFALLNSLIREFLSGVDLIKLKKKIEILALDFPDKTDHWILFSICDFQLGNEESAISMLTNLSKSNNLAILVKSQLSKVEYKNTQLENFKQILPLIDISRDTLYKKRGEDFRSQLKYLPQSSNSRIKVSIYNVDNNIFYNINFPGFASFSISEYSVSLVNQYSIYNPNMFSGWMVYNSNGVVFVSNKQYVLKYSNNQLINLYKF